jgi:lipoprotein-anchoring transpeptidase ErfK/SrfK
VPFLAALLALPARAEPTPSESPAQAETGTLGTETAPQAPDVAEEESAVEAPDAATGETEAAPEAPNAATTEPAAPKSTILVDIDKATQEMTVFVDGVQRYSWPVSTGMSGYSTPSGTYTASSMNEMWYSKQWDNAPMPNAIFFTKKGHAIHGTLDEKRLGNAASHGCVRLSRENAKTLFTLVKETGLENTQVVLSGVTKGGEGPKVASPSGESYDAYPPWFGRGYNYQPQERRKRRGLFGRRWFQPGTQGYYAPAPRYYPRGVSPRGY